MENIKVNLNDSDLFDKLVKTGLPEGNDLQIVTKDNATVGGKPAVCLAFSVQLPDGTIATAQYVTTVKLLIANLKLLEIKYGGL